MRKLDSTRIFVSPSLVSGSVAIFFAIALLLFLNSSVLEAGGFFTDLLLGQDSSAGLVETAQQTTIEISELTLGNDTLNKILFFMFWMLIGLVVYISLSTIGSVIGEVTGTVEEMHYVHARREKLKENFFLRVGIRTASLIGIILFYLVFARFILSFSTLASRAWLGAMDTFSGWFYGFLGVVVLVLALHIFVILARLLAIRPRLYGGWDVLK